MQVVIMWAYNICLLPIQNLFVHMYVYFVETQWLFWLYPRDKHDASPVVDRIYGWKSWNELGWKYSCHNLATASRRTAKAWNARVELSCGMSLSVCLSVWIEHAGWDVAVLSFLIKTERVGGGVRGLIFEAMYGRLFEGGRVGGWFGMQSIMSHGLELATVSSS